MSQASRNEWLPLRWGGFFYVVENPFLLYCGRMMTIFGDSLTGNRFGISYRNHLPQDKYSFRGIDGQNCLQITHRALGFMERESADVVLEGGGNDILDICRSWGCLPLRKPKAGADFEAFQDWRLRMAVRGHTVSFLEGEGFEAILKPVLEREAQYAEAIMALPRPVWVCAVTVMTENIGNLFNRLGTEWNNALRKHIGEERFLDIRTPLLGLLKGNDDMLGGNLDELMEDRAFISGSEEKAAELSASRGLGATVDGMHTNAKGAAAIAKAIDERFAKRTAYAL